MANDPLDPALIRQSIEAVRNAAAGSFTAEAELPSNIELTSGGISNFQTPSKPLAPQRSIDELRAYLKGAEATNLVTPDIISSTVPMSVGTPQQTDTVSTPAQLNEIKRQLVARAAHSPSKNR